MSSRKNKLKGEVHAFIINWNQKWPIDYWWRKKYKIPFGSEEHRRANFIQMYYDYFEDKILTNLYSKKDDSKEDFETSSLHKTKTGKKITKEEIDRDFENIDLSRYNTIKEDKNHG